MEHKYNHNAPYDQGHLPVGDIHVLHYGQYGNPQGKPIIFNVGGPGGTTTIKDTVYFNPEVYRVVLYDQRGAGQSTPSAETRENTSHHMVADIEALRRKLGISKWHMVFGGSWGSFLSLMYAQAHPARVGSLVLRGVFAGRQSELDFHRGRNGAAMLLPQEYSCFLKPLAGLDCDGPVRGYAKLLASSDADVRRDAARAFNAFDLWTSRVDVSTHDWQLLDDEKWCMEHAVLECHYFNNSLFIEDGELLRRENIDRIRHIPCAIVQGQYDTCTAPKTAWDLHNMWPESTLHMIPNAGHSAQEPGILCKLIEVCDKFAHL